MGQLQQVHYLFVFLKVSPVVAVSPHVPVYTCYLHQPDYRNQKGKPFEISFHAKKTHKIGTAKGGGKNLQKFTKTQQKIKKYINKISLPLLKEKDVFEHEEREGWHLLSIVNNKRLDKI